eukprot:361139-Chlamydomonas_euryale.AAC.1
MSILCGGPCLLDATGQSAPSRAFRTLDLRSPASRTPSGLVPLHTSYRTGQKSVGQTMGLRDRPRGRRDRTQIYRAGSPACPTALSGIISVTCGTA